MTPEEKKEAKRIYKAKYYKENKEIIDLKNKKWREDNYEHSLANAAEYRKKNREFLRQSSKRTRESYKDGYFSVYYIPEHHYVGQTISFISRMRKHKYGHGRITEGAEVLAKFETREEALAFEAKLHDMGYHGKNNGI